MHFVGINNLLRRTGIIPALGMLSMLIPVFSRRPIVGYPYVAAATVLTGVVGFGVWLHHMFAVGMSDMEMSFFSAGSMLVSIFTIVQIFAWVATIWRGRTVLTTSMLYGLGSIVSLVVGGLSGVYTAIIPVDWQVHDTYFVVAHSGQGWIAIGGMLIPFIVSFVLFILGLKLLASFPIHEASQQMNMKPDILVVGHQWWWEVHYLSEHPANQVTSANEIHIPANRPVTIELESRDVIHSFWVPALHGKVDLIPGHPNFVRVEASHPGSYAGQCAEYCGAQHAHMRLLVIAQPPDQYQAWLNAQREPGRTPATANAEEGQKIFLAGPCSMCHTVRGTTAGGSVAPDLTHIGSRQFIAANSFPNDDAYLEAWVTHAQSLKPEALMPDFTRFTGVQMRDLVAYLRQLQ